MTFIFLGRRGVGKTTLLNALLGECAFEHGGGGTLQRHRAGGIAYVEVPGFYAGDAGLNEDSAAEMTRWLKSGDDGVKLVFVVALGEGGRIDPADSVLIKLVLDALPGIGGGFQYGIVVNKVKKEIMDGFHAEPAAWERARACLNLGHQATPTAYIHLFNYVEALDGEGDALHIPTFSLRRFLDVLPSTRVKPDEVRYVNSTEFDSLLRTHDPLLRRLDVSFGELRHDRNRLQQKRPDGAELMSQNAQEDQDKLFRAGEKRKRSTVSSVTDGLRSTRLKAESGFTQRRPPPWGGDATLAEPSKDLWKLSLTDVRPLPPHYPLTPSTIFCHYLRGDDKEGLHLEPPPLPSIQDFCLGISVACKDFGIGGYWKNHCPSAVLILKDGMEMTLRMHLVGVEDKVIVGGLCTEVNGVCNPSTKPNGCHPQALLIEAHRQRGCSLGFHHTLLKLFDAVAAAAVAAAATAAAVHTPEGHRLRENPPMQREEERIVPSSRNHQNSIGSPANKPSEGTYASHHKWDAIDCNLPATEDANALFQQVYKNADEVTRSAMVKRMQLLPPSSNSIRMSNPPKPSSPVCDVREKRRRRPCVLNLDQAADKTDKDVLFGRGGSINCHPGNVEFRNEVRKLLPRYEQSSKPEKQNIANMLIESVKVEGGRFLAKGDDGLWHEVNMGEHTIASMVFRDFHKRSAKASSAQQVYSGEEPGGARTLLESKQAGTYDANAGDQAQASSVAAKPGAQQVYGGEEPGGASTLLERKMSDTYDANIIKLARVSGAKPGEQQVYAGEERGVARTLLERKHAGTYDANIFKQARASGVAVKPSISQISGGEERGVARTLLERKKYRKGEQMMASAVLEQRTEEVLPRTMSWDLPPDSRKNINSNAITEALDTGPRPQPAGSQYIVAINQTTEERRFFVGRLNEFDRPAVEEYFKYCGWKISGNRVCGEGMDCYQITDEIIGRGDAILSQKQRVNTEASFSNADVSRGCRDNEPTDVLSQLVAEKVAEVHSNNSQETIKLIPESPLFTSSISASVLDGISDPISFVTPASHILTEPESPTLSIRDFDNFLESSAPNPVVLREIVDDLTRAGADAEAIDVVITPALIHSNSTAISVDVVLFCLTTLLDLAHKSEENTRKIIFQGATLDAIIDAMRIYSRISVGVQKRACELLWTLSRHAKLAVHVAQSGGCRAILNAVLVYMEEYQLQVMALRALKALSSDTICKQTLRSDNASFIVAKLMQKHAHNPIIQCEGNAILGNLSMNEANQFVHPVTENEVKAVVNGIIANPDSLEVHEAACSTLMRLASLAANVRLIRSNSSSRTALDLVLNQTPDKVGSNITILLRRLGFDSAVITELKDSPQQEGLWQGTKLEHSPMKILFIGRVGVGKTTLLNALAGKCAFKHGSVHTLQLHEAKGVVYIDTPGFDTSEQAVAHSVSEIMQGLKFIQDDFKLVFVVTLAEGGLVNPVDGDIMKLILDVLPMLPNSNKWGASHGIIINKTTEEMRDNFNTEPVTWDRVKACLNLGHPPTSYLHLCDYVAAPDSNKKILHSSTFSLRRFLDVLPSIRVKPDKVRDVNSAKFESLLHLINTFSRESRSDTIKVQENLDVDGANLQAQRAKIEDDQGNLFRAGRNKKVFTSAVMDNPNPTKLTVNPSSIDQSSPLSPGLVEFLSHQLFRPKDNLEDLKAYALKLWIKRKEVAAEDDAADEEFEKLSRELKKVQEKIHKVKFSSLPTEEADAAKTVKPSKEMWKLSLEDVNALPSYYPLTPSTTGCLYLRGDDQQGLHLEASSLPSIQEVSLGISTACKDLCIGGYWHNNCPSAALVVNDGVEMILHMHLVGLEEKFIMGGSWTKISSICHPITKPDGCHHQALLIEVQRQKGCSLSFHNTWHKVFNAAKLAPANNNAENEIKRRLHRKTWKVVGYDPASAQLKCKPRLDFRKSKSDPSGMKAKKEARSSRMEEKIGSMRPLLSRIMSRLKFPKLKSDVSFIYTGIEQVPKDVTYVEVAANVPSIGSHAFSGCKKLKRVDLPEGLQTIEEGAFSGCKSLESIFFPSSVTIIGTHSFYYCKKLKSVQLPEGLKAIESGAFSECESLEDILIPSSAASIDAKAFFGCKNLKSVHLPKSLVTVEESVLSHCQSLKRIQIPATVTAIHRNAFLGCKDLTSVQLPKSLPRIGENAFSGCLSLESINISSSTVIGKGAFSGCKSFIPPCESFISIESTVSM